MSLNVDALNYNYSTPAFGSRQVPQFQESSYADLSKAEADTYEPSTPKEEKKSGGLFKKFGILAGVAVGIDLIFFKGKHVKGLINKIGNLFGKGSAKTAEEGAKEATKGATKLEKAQAKEWEAANRPSKKKRVKNTSSNGARKPVSNAQEAKTLENINTQNVNGNTRKMVEEAKAGTVTAEQQAKYDSEIAFKPCTKEEQTAMDNLHSRNAQERKEMNSVANNSKGGENLDKVKKQMVAAEKAERTVLKDGEYTLDGNRYIIKDGTITEMTLKGAQKPQTKAQSIYKHENKNHVLERLKNGEGQGNMIANAA